MKTILVVSPHPDDETLGCGGSLLKHRAGGDAVYWLIVTAITRAAGYTAARMQRREKEIATVSARYGFKGVRQLGFSTKRLDAMPMADLIEKTSAAIGEVKPDLIYVPDRGDIHTDHRIVFDAVASCTKWFRVPFVQRILAYETLSETGIGLDLATGFKPNVYVDITPYLDEKIRIMKLYKGETGLHPFPRSQASMRAQAVLRGAESGFEAAEAFVLLKERLS